MSTSELNLYYDYGALYICCQGSQSYDPDHTIKISSQIQASIIIAFYSNTGITILSDNLVNMNLFRQMKKKKSQDFQSN